MNRVIEFFKITIVGGFFVVLPVVLVAFLITEAFGLLVMIIDPVAMKFPVQSLGGIELAYLLVFLLFVGLCFITGLLMGTHIGLRFGGWLSQNVLTYLPGYDLVKSLTRRISGDAEDSRFSPAVVKMPLQETMMLGFVVEEHANGDFSVLIPTAPNPTVGSISYVKKDRVHQLDVPLSEVINCIAQWGVGSKELFLKAQ